mmetsp:Transcript_4461/g.5160  ORF Transcript_4461/g.5160 Transcript_4461/m.5160 type:complete len:433 (-) Transcript_4461:422-1720(-)
MVRFSTATIVAQLLYIVLQAHYSISFTAASQNNDKLPQRPTVNNGTTNDPSSKSNTDANPTSLTMSDHHQSSQSSNTDKIQAQAGKIKELKKREAALSRLLTAVRLEKLSALRSRPLTIGVVGFGRFGQFIAETFNKHGRVVATSRSDYTELAKGMGITYIRLDDPASFLEQDLDVIILATSIVSFEATVRNLAPHLKAYIEKSETNRGPLVIDVLSVKEHPRQILIDLLPKECDIMCTHPMFGPDSGSNGWHGLNFVYERTRIDGVILDSTQRTTGSTVEHDNVDVSKVNTTVSKTFVEKGTGKIHNVHEDSELHVESIDRMERFLSIWEEEGCRMVELSCKDHDAYAANSQFLTHLMGRILGEQGLKQTPIDTKGFESVLNLVGTTTADSFDLFYGLYKYNQNSVDTIVKLKASMDGVVTMLKEMEEKDI